MRGQSMRISNKILRGDQTMRTFLHDRPGMLTRDLFAVVKLLVKWSPSAYRLLWIIYVNCT